jgi:hypothetical protein
MVTNIPLKNVRVLIFSLVMELADESDVYKKIVDSQANKVYLKEKFVWKVLI